MVIQNNAGYQRSPFAFPNRHGQAYNLNDLLDDNSGSESEDDRDEYEYDEAYAAYQQGRQDERNDRNRNVRDGSRSC